jgi:hypothetical protein
LLKDFDLVQAFKVFEAGRSFSFDFWSYFWLDPKAGIPPWRDRIAKKSSDLYVLVFCWSGECMSAISLHNFRRSYEIYTR